MLKPSQIYEGGFYVSEKKGIVREVWKEENGDAYWRSYELRSGDPTGDSLVCSKYTLSQWADREATPEEVARMKRGQANVNSIANAMEMVNLVLKNVSDEQLLAEVRRRDLDLNDELPGEG